jgi:ribonuclease HI
MILLEIIVYTDGASRGNPGKAGIGAVIYDENGQVLKEISDYIGETTNNVAEYKAVIAGLRAGLELKATIIEVNADSQLLVRQLNGDYRVKNEGLKPLYKEAVNLLSRYKSYKIIHIPREKNKVADKLANRGIDKS